MEDFFDTPPTPLWHLRHLAAELGLGDILLKDESTRMGLNSFKILGVSYAIHRLLEAGAINRTAVLACATEGNHGLAVARAAREHSLSAMVYVPGDLKDARVKTLEREGAQVVKVDGDYDDAVRMLSREASLNQWTIISDTSWPGYEEVPHAIMAGYTHLMVEAVHQLLPDSPPDVVIVQAGVGGLAGAVMSWLCHRYGTDRPFTILCEPKSADCFLESASAGNLVLRQGPFDTIMAGLRCGEPSAIAWPVIASSVDAFVSIEDDWVRRAMKFLAHPSHDDPVVTAGASGACGLATLLAILQDSQLRQLCEESGIGPKSRVLVVNTEGATDPELYERIMKAESNEI
ncbi:MAG: diaminopropionate ammonia-lyase [Acidobacteriota bacterium]